MAKSTRSKVKRHYRAKKREEGVYAAVEAARLERLSAKLAAVKESKKIAAIGGDDANEREDEEHGLGKNVDGEEIEAGSLWYLAFGLLDPSTISFESLECLSNAFETTFS
jgi:hypothetical protein